MTSLRAIAATMVVIVHTGAFANAGWIGANITDAGGAGVYIFFVISGFSVSQSLKVEPSFFPYIIRRLFRIAPPYFLLLLAMYGLVLTGWLTVEGNGLTRGDFNLYNLLMHLSFLSFFDSRIANSIIFVEWTLPIEIVWYLIIPIILYWCRNTLHFIVAFIVTIIIAELTRPVMTAIPVEQPKVSAHYFPTGYGFYFVLGCFAQYYRDRLLAANKSVKWWVLALGCLIFFISVVLGVGNPDRLCAIATLLILCGYQKPHESVRTVFENKALLFVGTISYGIYLLHMPVSKVLQQHFFQTWQELGFFVVYPVTLLLATVLYLLVERPANRLGKSLSRATYMPVRAKSD